MTGSELRGLFNIQYNNIFSGYAPGINDYEISVYLTKAVKELVQTYYTGQADGNSVDSTEELRELLAFYTKEKNISDLTITNSRFTFVESIVPLDNTIWYILSEFVQVNDNWIKVSPIPYGMLHAMLNNPFRQPNAYKAYRTEINGTTGVEFRVYTNETPSIYSINYIETPEPIIIDNLNNTLPGLQIDGKYSVNIPQYPNTWMWTLIVNRAVELATRDYKANDLSTQVQLNSRVQ